jgi:ADP-ribose pyrophosphatase YjhB (NUDIX family)
VVNPGNTIRLRIAAIILNKKNELLLVNHQKNGRSYWLLPGGGVEFGETLEQALARELKEELSVKMEKMHNLVFINDSIYPDKTRHILNLYFRATIKENRKMKANPDAVLRGAEYVSAEKFGKILFYPDIKSAIIKMWKKGFNIDKGYIKTKFKK